MALWIWTPDRPFLFCRKSSLLLCAKHFLHSWENILIAPNFLQQAWSQHNHLQEQLFSWKPLWTQLIRLLCVWQAPCHVKGTKRQHRMCTHSSNPYQHFSGSWQRHPHESTHPPQAGAWCWAGNGSKARHPTLNNEIPFASHSGTRDKPTQQCSLQPALEQDHVFWQGFHAEDRLLQSNSYMPAFEF